MSVLSSLTSCLCVTTAIVLVGLAATSFSTLHATEWGLVYDNLKMTVSTSSSEAGLHLVGPFSHFIRYPNTMQNIQFSTGDNDLLHTRTSDGLPLTLGISFQYTLMREHLHDLYMTYGDDYKPILFNMASDSIANTCANYTAYNFFNDKQSIGITMQQALNDVLKPQMFLRVETLQIILVQLPLEFENAILESISVKQNITRTQKQMETAKVTFETTIMAANQVANQTVTEAEGMAQRITAEQGANAQAFLQTLEAETHSYKLVQQALKLSPSELLEYVWWDSMGDQQTESEFVVGIQPSTYIRN